MDCRGCRYYHDLADNHCLKCDGSGYTRPSNADRIRSMTDEELAQFMFTANGCPMWVSEYSCKEDKGCAGAKGACWLDWLRQEADMEATE